MRFLLLSALVATLLMPATALALVEVDIAFDPTEVCPGDEASFFFALENVGAEETEVTLAFTFEFMGHVMGPFECYPFPLAAGEAITHEAMLMIPPMAPAGTIVITVDATDDDGTVTDTASLTILDCGGERGKDPKLAQSEKAV
ncbi:MAG: hypothetical protein ABIK85_09810, partial [Candidatus Eisenbacteria bacterium]